MPLPEAADTREPGRRSAELRRRVGPSRWSRRRLAAAIDSPGTGLRWRCDGMPAVRPNGIQRSHCRMAAPATSEPRTARQPALPAHEPYVPDSSRHARVHLAGRPGRRGAGDRLRGLVAIPGAEGRFDRLGVDSRGRTVDHAVPTVLAHVRHSPRDDPGKQHRADHRLGRRVDRLRRRRHDPGPDAAWAWTWS